MAEKKEQTKKEEYGNQSITQLKGADRVRKRPAVIFGSDGLEGCAHAVFEIVSNSVDEAKEGYGNVIRVTRFADRSIEVEDDGRGIPMGYNEKEKRYNWDLIFCELYAGGKYENNKEGSNYGFSLGLNGLGACATQCASEYMDVRSYSGGILSEMHFKKGMPSGKLKETPLTPKEKKHGTVIRWLPDLEVFTDTDIPKEYYEEMLKRQAVVNSGVRFLLRNETEKGRFEEEEFYYENGIADRVAELALGASLTEPVFFKTETAGRDRADLEDYKLKMEMSFCVSNREHAIEYYHNSSYLEHGGSPEKATKSAFVSAIDKYLRNSGKYRKNESKITFADVSDCLILVVNSFSTKTSYENQTKKAINNAFIADAMTEWFKKTLEIYFIERPLEAEKIGNQVLINKRSRESAESTRLDIRKKLSGNMMDVANRVDKFVGCRSKDETKREVYIVEGDSAMSSCKMARNAEFQAVFPVRGKTLNCMKSTYDKIFKSEVVVNLLKVIGCGVELSGKVKGDLAPFDRSALKWNRIIICTDADEDGFQIRTLLLTVFYRLLPSLIEMGRVYIAETPLYEITVGEETYFAYDEKEKAEQLRKIGNKKYSLQRSKGLGENTPEMMSKTTMNPATRRLIRVSPADAQKTAEIFEILLGDDLEGRKQFIAENGFRYAGEADV
ncbi:MAG TPA: DNA topoisomerase [Clostridiales bacterium]|nr:DNA topoisomerase [Clostridiales bacterium]